MCADWVGPNSSQKMNVSCPKCGTKNEILWIPAQQMSYRGSGTTGISETKYSRKSEKVQGVCSECGSKFKPDDLD